MRDSTGIETKAVAGFAWLIAIELANGQTVALYPISIINPLAPPSFHMTQITHGGICNTRQKKTIVNHLKRWCDDESLDDAVKYLKKAINSISR